MNIIARIRRAAVAFSALAALAICADAAAQFGPIIELPDNLPTVMPAAPVGGYPATSSPTAAATYLAPPAWSQTLAVTVRFVILSNFNSDAVLDRETGLVWTRQTVRDAGDRELAAITCRSLVLGNRMGWRLPTASELQSLVDSLGQQTPAFGPSLPAGHPFLLPEAGGGVLRPHWAEEITLGDNIFQLYVNMAGGAVGYQQRGFAKVAGVMCVRTGPAL
jgi:hypothetical protein